MSSALRVARHDDAEIKARMIAVSRVGFIPTSREQFQVVPRAAVRYTHSSAAFTLRRGLGRDAPTAFLVVCSADLEPCDRGATGEAALSALAHRMLEPVHAGGEIVQKGRRQAMSNELSR